jgi:hypothetical protein
LEHLTVICPDEHIIPFLENLLKSRTAFSNMCKITLICRVYIELPDYWGHYQGRYRKGLTPSVFCKGASWDSLVSYFQAAGIEVQVEAKTIHHKACMTGEEDFSEDAN